MSDIEKQLAAARYELAGLEANMSVLEKSVSGTYAEAYGRILEQYRSEHLQTMVRIQTLEKQL